LRRARGAERVHEPPIKVAKPARSASLQSASMRDNSRRRAAVMARTI
jgi:hypothetical protein